MSVYGTCAPFTSRTQNYAGQNLEEEVEEGMEHEGKETKRRNNKGTATRKGEVGEEYEGKDRENLGDGSIEEE